MENLNRPVQRVFPIRSQLPSRVDSNINVRGSTSCIEAIAANNAQQFNIISDSKDRDSNNSVSVMTTLPVVQQNVNIMNINLSSNSVIQGMSQDHINSFAQSSVFPQTYLQLADGRYVQIAQNMQQPQPQLQTILLQMPYNCVEQSITNNKQFLLPTKVGDQLGPIPRLVSIGTNPGATSTMFISNQKIEPFAQVGGQIKPMDVQRQAVNNFQQRNTGNHLKQSSDQRSNGFIESNLTQNINSNVNIISMDKYKEICDLLLDKKLLSRSTPTVETVLVEFRLNQQKYQLRMTRNQKVDMERLLLSAGNQQRQMEILQVYQSEQRKILQQRTSVVLNQIIHKNPPNILGSQHQIPTLNISTPSFPVNSVFMNVVPSQLNDGNICQSPNIICQPKPIPTQPTVCLQNPNNAILMSQPSVAQPTINLVPSNQCDLIQEPMKQTRVTKAPLNFTQNIPNLSSNQDMKPARSRRFNNIRRVLSEDHSSVTMPDCDRCFEDQNDVARRLLPYHILDESKEQRFDEVDRILSTTFEELNRRCTNLKRVASSIAMHDIINDKSHEILLMKRMQLDLDMDLLDREKAAFACGDGCPVRVIDWEDEDDDCSDGMIVIEDPTNPFSEPDINSQINNNDNIETIGRMSFLDSIECSTNNDGLDPGPTSESVNDNNYPGDGDEYAVLGDDDQIHWLMDKDQDTDPDLETAIKSILF